MPNDDRYLILVEGSGGTTSEDIKRALSQGTAVLRSVSDFNEFDTHLRHDEGITDLPQFPSQVDETSLEEYMYLTLQNHAAAHSESLATFLTALEETATEHSLQYVQYLLPSVKKSKKFEPIPRLGSFQKTVDTLLPGWWIVWYLEIQDADAPLEFKIYTTTVSGNEDLVHQETCTCTQNVYFGSYRIPPPQKTQAVLKVTGRSIIGNAKPKVFLECDGIPHEAFRAACTAASDTNIAAHRRRVAPLLSRIFDITDPIVRVKLWHDDEREKNLVQQSEVDTSQFQDLNEQIQRLKQSVELLEIENSSLRTDSVQSHAQIEGLRRKLDQAESERRVWNVVRSELQAELTRLSQHLTSETNDKVRVSHELEVAQQEVQALSGQVKLLELQVSPKGGSISSNRSQHVAVLTATVKRLEMQLKTEEGNYAKLQVSLQQMKQAYEHTLAETRNDLHVAKMEQRILESQVKQLEKTRRSDSSVMTPGLYRELDATVVSFEHPDPRLNKQLATLRDRHRKLSSILAQNPNHSKNLEILGMLEKAINDIVASAR